MRKVISSCLNIIRQENKIVGLTLIFPCRKELMNDFISKKITEADLLDKLKKSPSNRKPEAIYLCSALIKPEFRGKGLALKSFIKSIKNNFNLKYRPPLFYWGYSNEGDALSNKIAKILNLPIYKRKDN